MGGRRFKRCGLFHQIGGAPDRHPIGAHAARFDRRARLGAAFGEAARYEQKVGADARHRFVLARCAPARKLERMQSRRSVIAAPLGLAACVTTPAAEPSDAESAFLARVIEAAGGEQALSDARVLAWTGRAIVRAGDQPLEIGVNTVVEPFRYARSETWLISAGRDSTRILEIEGDQGWAIRNGSRDPLPTAQTIHERQQYTLYGLMRFVSLREPNVRLAVNPKSEDEPLVIAGAFLPGTRYQLTIEHPEAPRTIFNFDQNYRLLWAQNSVTSPDGGGQRIDQTFRFTDTIEGNGVLWPRRMTIYQGASAQSYFELNLETFTPRQQR
jgi:hypothetical protein